VHPDRIILFCEGSEDDNILSGIPLLEAGYNDLLDIEKTKGGSAEGFLKNASRQLALSSKRNQMDALKKLRLMLDIKTWRSAERQSDQD
jgi:hypothetical protein